MNTEPLVLRKGEQMDIFGLQKHRDEVARLGTLAVAAGDVFLVRYPEIRERRQNNPAREYLAVAVDSADRDSDAALCVIAFHDCEREPVREVLPPNVDVVRCAIDEISVLDAGFK